MRGAMMGFFAQFTLAELVNQIVWTGILLVLGRLAMFILKLPPKKERLYWLFGPFVILGLVAFSGSRGDHSQYAPRIVAKIDSIILGTDPYRSTRTMLVLVISARNAGMPTILEDWRVSAALNDGRVLSGELQRIPDSITFGSPDHDALQYFGKDAIYEKTLMTPIPTGGIVRGILWARFDGFSSAQFSSTTPRISVTFDDVAGQKYAIEATVKAGSDKPMYYPGMSQEVK
jgi:hypothetical protein